MEHQCITTQHLFKIHSLIINLVLRGIAFLTHNFIHYFSAGYRISKGFSKSCLGSKKIMGKDQTRDALEQYGASSDHIAIRVFTLVDIPISQKYNLQFAPFFRPAHFTRWGATAVPDVHRR